MAIIEASGLVKRFGSFTAVRGISFAIEAGEVAGLLGANGAGKTTTMRLLTGYFAPTEGRVTIAGHDMAHATHAAQSQIGYLPETPPVYPEMHVRGYLEFVARLRGGSYRQARVAAERAMERCWIADRADWVIGTLSRGYRQRVGIAQAIVCDPKVLILDEPTSGLDPEQIVMVRRLVAELARDRTVLFSTHVLAEAEKVCSRVLVIRDGELLADEPVATLLEPRGPLADVRLSVHGPRESVLAALWAIPGVRKVAVDAVQGPGGSLHLSIAATRDPLLVNQISRRLLEGGWTVDRIEIARQTLEDAYFKIVGATSESAAA